jgi:hypothetical protein
MVGFWKRQNKINIICQQIIPSLNKINQMKILSKCLDKQKLLHKMLYFGFENNSDIQITLNRLL